MMSVFSGEGVSLGEALQHLFDATGAAVEERLSAIFVFADFAEEAFFYRVDGRV